MARNATPPGPPRAKTVQLKFRLVADLNDRVEAAAAAHGWGVSEEIRRRLEASFAAEPPATADPKTGNLLDYINTLADVVSAHFGDWHSDPGAFAVFRLAIEKILSDVCPEGEPLLNPTSRAKALMPDPTNIEAAAGMVSAVALWWLPGDKS
jgi:hypothetical protein